MLNSPVDLAIVFGIALLVFGPKKLPELGKSLGQGIGNFKKSLHDAQEEVKAAVKSDPKSDAKSDASPEGAEIKAAGGTCCGGAHGPDHEHKSSG